jgi:outer membrane biosynthesis protein TonB
VNPHSGQGPEGRTSIVDRLVGVMVSVTVHVGVVLFLVVLQQRSPPADEPTTLVNFIEAELLMYGEVMPVDGQLPWIANPEPAPPDALPPQPEDDLTVETSRPEQEVVRPPTPEPPPTPPPERPPEENRARPEPVQREAAPARDRGPSNPNRPTNRDPLVGSRDGFVGGTSLSETALRNQYARIIQQISRAVRRPAGIPDSQYARLRCRLHIRASEAGRIIAWEWLERSGNAMYDAAVESALNSFRQGSVRLELGSLNPEVRQQFIARGINLTITP